MTRLSPPGRATRPRPRRGLSARLAGAALAALVALVGLTACHSGPTQPGSPAPSVLAPTTAHTGARTTSPTSGATAPTTARTTTQTDPASHLPTVRESALPSQARDTLTEIRNGGPYRYPKNDDVVFENRESVLPRQAAGYYKEYTVVTPGSPDRGARRIIVGKDGAKYYTDNHYATFSRILEGQ